MECWCESLLNNKKALKDIIIAVLKGSKKFLVEGNSPQSWPWEQNGTTGVVAVMILWATEEACYR